MSFPKAPDPVKLVVGVLLGDKSLLADVAAVLGHRFGRLDLASPWLSFDYTDYYGREMGAPLYRRMMAYRDLVDPGTLADVKWVTNGIESRYRDHGARRVNLDPGFLTLSQFVLATGKNYAHRIYIGRGIYADLTLLFHGGRFASLPWTYPDYADGAIQGFLSQVRTRYRHDRKATSS
jgi:hypothetical protein